MVYMMPNITTLYCSLILSNAAKGLGLGVSGVQPMVCVMPNITNF